MKIFIKVFGPYLILFVYMWLALGKYYMAYNRLYFEFQASVLRSIGMTLTDFYIRVAIFIVLAIIASVLAYTADR